MASAQLVSCRWPWPRSSCCPPRGCCRANACVRRMPAALATAGEAAIAAGETWSVFRAVMNLVQTLITTFICPAARAATVPSIASVAGLPSLPTYAPIAYRMLHKRTCPPCHCRPLRLCPSGSQPARQPFLPSRHSRRNGAARASAASSFDEAAFSLRCSMMIVNRRSVAHS